MEVNRILIEFTIKENTSDKPLHLISTIKNYKQNINNPQNKLKFGLNKINSLNIPNNLNYEGQVPDFKYFKNISLTYYNKYSEDYKYVGWSLRRETEKYCNQDCKALYEVLVHFFEENFKVTNVNGSTYPSLSSLSLANYRTQFMPDNVQITNLRGEVYNYIKQGYFGGAVDVYKPYGTKLYIYDVNSEYPEAMCQDLPGEKVHYLEGDINLNDNSTFGFFKAEIEVDNNINIPVLPMRINNTSICGVGKWTGWYFSEELKDAQDNYGYKIKLIKGYEFSKTDLFSSYVEHFYDKKKFSTTSAERLIAKMQLNQLYGIFGRKQELIETINIPKKDIIRIVENDEVVDEIDTVLRYLIFTGNEENTGTIRNKLNLKLASDEEEKSLLL